MSVQLRRLLAQTQDSLEFWERRLEYYRAMNDADRVQQAQTQIAEAQVSIGRLEKMIWSAEHPTPAGLWARITGKK